MVSKGYRFNSIEKDKVEKVGYSDKGNLIVKFFNVDEWFFVYNNNRTKIHKSTLKTFEVKKELGNKDILAYLVARLPADNGE